MDVFLFAFFNISFTHSQHYLLAHLNVPPVRCPEIVISGTDNKILETVMEEVMC